MRDIFSFPSVVYKMLVEYKAAQRKLEGHAIAEKIDGRSKIPLGIWK